MALEQSNYKNVYRKRVEEIDEVCWLIESLISEFINLK